MADPSTLRFATAPMLEGRVVLAAAAVLVVVVLALRLLDRTGGNDWIAFWLVLLGAGGLAFAGLSFETRVDTAKRQVTSRIAWSGHGIDTAYAFADFDRVVVSLTRSSENEAVTTTGSGFRKNGSRTRTRHAYEVTLAGPLHSIGVALPDGDDAAFDTAEAAALRVAQAGGWPARRRGYTVAVRPDGAGREVRHVAVDAESPLMPR